MVPIAIAFGALGALAAPVHADATPEFIHEYQAGVDAYRLGKYVEAKAHLEKARAIDPKLPGAHRFLAAVAQAETRWADCIAEARIAIGLNPLSKEIAETRKLHDDCRASDGRPQFRGDLVENGAVAATTTPPGASVTINHLMYGGTPLLPRTIPVGPIDVEIAKAGYKPVHLTDIVTLPGVVTDIEVTLEVDPGDANQKVEDPSRKPNVAQGYLVVPASVDARIDDARVEPGKVARDPGTYTVELRLPGKDPWRRRVRVAASQAVTLAPSFIDTDARERTEQLGSIVVASGLAVIAAGFVATLYAHDAAADAREWDRVERNRDPSIPNSTDVEPRHTQAEIDAANSRAHRDWLIADVAFGVGVATLAVGAYALYRGAPERTDAPARFAIIPTTTGALVTHAVTW